MRYPWRAALASAGPNPGVLRPGAPDDDQGSGRAGGESDTCAAFVTVSLYCESPPHHQARRQGRKGRARWPLREDHIALPSTACNSFIRRSSGNRLAAKRFPGPRPRGWRPRRPHSGRVGCLSAGLTRSRGSPSLCPRRGAPCALSRIVPNVIPNVIPKQ
jgi:hypothetical protein